MLRRLVLVLVVVGVVIVGCDFWGSAAPVRPVASIGPAEDFRCRIPVIFEGNERPAPGTVPDGFDPVAAVTCAPFFDDDIAADKTAGLREYRWEGDFNEIVRLLNRPSERTSWFTGPCNVASMAELEDMWLLDGTGRAVEPGYPVDSCGFEMVGGLAAVQELTLVETVVHRIPLDDDQIEQVSGCAPIFAAPVVGTAVPGPLSVGSAFCRFEAGQFAGTAHAYVDIGRLASAPECFSAATTVASTTFTESTTTEQRRLTVEFDGCRRVIADGYAPLRATEELLESFPVGGA